MLSIGPRAQRAVALLGLALLLASFVTFFVRATDDSRAARVGPTPADAVQQFLVNAVGDNNGREACRYLTAAEKAQVGLRGGSPVSCGNAFDTATLRLGGKTYGTERSVDHGLTYTTTPEGNVMLVRVSHGTASLDFGVVPATAVDCADFDAPATPWRIAAGATAIVPQRNAP